MKIIKVKELAIPEVKILQFARFKDDRGYFTEPYRKSDFSNDFIKDFEVFQTNESYSRANVIRGLHFQWNPYMGKLVRTLKGRMVDMVMDIRKGSPTYGKIITYDMPTNHDLDYDEWIWVPPGFAHGNFFTEESVIEYYCTGEYSPGCEAGISPLSKDIDWSLCDMELKKLFDSTVGAEALVSDKDKNGLTLQQWTEDPRSENFTYGKL